MAAAVPAILVATMINAWVLMRRSFVPGTGSIMTVT
jgi:hypothetical protein